MKKYTACFLAFVCIFFVLMSAGCNRLPTEEKNNNYINWAFDETTGSLTISGKGPLDYRERYLNQPWSEYKDLTKAIIIEEGITKVGYCEFSTYMDVESVTLPDSLTEIGEGAFANCINIEVLEIPSSVTKIERPADETVFIDRYKVDVNNQYYSTDEYGVLFNKDKTKLLHCPRDLTSYQIPDSVTEIGCSAFQGTCLTSVIIPDSVTTIDGHAFFSCLKLMDIEIPASVTAIGDAAFSTYSCDDFDEYRDIYYSGTEDDWEKINMQPEFPSANIHFDCTMPEE